MFDVNSQVLACSLTKEVVESTKATVVYVATDKDPMLDQLREALGDKVLRHGTRSIVGVGVCCVACVCCVCAATDKDPVLDCMKNVLWETRYLYMDICCVGTFLVTLVD